jgi:hypothetical protein
MLHIRSRELMMGHSVKLDDVYYDKDNEISQQKCLLLEYMKAIDALTINDEYRLKKKIVEYEEKLKDVPKVEQLVSHLTNKIFEQEVIIGDCVCASRLTESIKSMISTKPTLTTGIVIVIGVPKLAFASSKRSTLNIAF